MARLSAWGALVPVVALAAGLLFATSGRTAQGTDLRAGEITALPALIRERDPYCLFSGGPAARRVRLGDEDFCGLVRGPDHREGAR